MSKIIQRTYEFCRGKSPWAATGLFICALNGSCLAANETSTADEQSSTLEPVVVTARRQNENLEKVPVAISALSQQDLAERKITTEADLESAVPGLTVRAATTSNDVSFSLRGQSAEPFSYTAPAVLTYFDEFQTAGTTTTAFYDLQSVQVVKGPQGTLFGRNATGGAVMYTSAPPTKDFGGYVNVTYGNFDEQKVEAAVNLPMSSVASLRVAGEFEKRNGYEDNLYLNLWEGSVDDRNIRATLLLTPTDELQSSTVAQYERSGGYSAGTKLVGVYPCGSTYNGNVLNCAAATLYPPGNPAQIRFPQLAAFNGIEGFLAVQNGTRFWDIYNDQTSSHDAQTDVVVNKTTYAISDNLSVKNILGYNLVSTRDRPDVDGSPFEVDEVGVSTGVGGEGDENGYEIGRAHV